VIGEKARNCVNSFSIYGSKFFPNYDSKDNHSLWEYRAIQALALAKQELAEKKHQQSPTSLKCPFSSIH
jgi:hypothetical protein